MNGRARPSISFLLTMTGATCIAWCMASPAAALEPGEYEVSVQLDLPHIEGAGAMRTAYICVTAGGNDTRGLKVLSANHPFGGCSASNLREDARTIAFDIVCPGPNAASASARYTFGEQDFDGTIAMKMGAKNMTMTERQHGRRTGACRPRDQAE